MQPWVVRALVRAGALALVHAAGQVVVALVRARQPGDAGTGSVVTLGVLVGVAVLAGALDGWRRVPLAARSWFVAGLIAGPVAGLLGLVVRGLLVDGSGITELADALVGGAAFTALLVLVPAVVGIAVGRRLDPPRVVSENPVSPA